MHIYKTVKSAKTTKLASYIKFCFVTAVRRGLQICDSVVYEAQNVIMVSSHLANILYFK